MTRGAGAVNVPWARLGLLVAVALEPGVSAAFRLLREDPARDVTLFAVARESP